jgi:hypothetical protein
MAACALVILDNPSPAPLRGALSHQLHRLSFSLLLWGLAAACAQPGLSNDAGVGPSVDAGGLDSGADASTPDAGPDAGNEDAGLPDAGLPDAAGLPADAGLADAGVPDDAGLPDAGPTGDAGTWPAEGCEISGGICMASGTCVSAGGTVVATGGCTFSDGPAECCVPPPPSEEPTTCSAEGGLCAPIGGCLEAGGWLSYGLNGDALCPFDGDFACCVPHAQCGNATMDCCAWPTIYTQACFDGVLFCAVGSPVPTGTCGPDSGSGDAGPSPIDAGASPIDAGPGDGGPGCEGATSGSCPGAETCCECCGTPGSCNHSCLTVGPEGCPLCE